MDAGGREGLPPGRRAALIWPRGVEEAVMPLDISGPGRRDGTLVRWVAGDEGFSDESDLLSTSGETAGVPAADSGLLSIFLC